MFDMNLVHEFVATWNRYADDGLSWPDQINRGWCYQFAVLLYKAARLKGYQPVFMQSCNHAWVKVNGRHYDSAHLEGSEQPLGMCVWCVGDHTREVSPKECFKFWKRNGRSGPVRLPIIKKALDNALNRG